MIINLYYLSISLFNIDFHFYKIKRGIIIISIISIIFEKTT